MNKLLACVGCVLLICISTAIADSRLITSFHCYDNARVKIEGKQYIQPNVAEIAGCERSIVNETYLMFNCSCNDGNTEIYLQSDNMTETFYITEEHYIDASKDENSKRTNYFPNINLAPPPVPKDYTKQIGFAGLILLMVFAIITIFGIGGIIFYLFYRRKKNKEEIPNETLKYEKKCDVPKVKPDKVKPPKKPDNLWHP